MQITVVGSGYVGLVAAACFAEMGHDVLSIDNDERKIAALLRGEIGIHEEFLPELVARHRGKRLVFGTSIEDAVKVSSVVVIAVGTPAAENGEADLSFVESVAREIACLADGHGYKVVVEKSTVPVFTSRWIRTVMLRSGAEPSAFDVVSNPEFLREGTAVTDFLYADRIIIGADNERSAAILQELYRPLLDGSYYERKQTIALPPASACSPKLILTSTESAELTKHACNAFLAMKISFINAVANLCEAAGANIEEVCHGIGSDTRIGDKFLLPGIGFGGSCFPKDLKAFRAVARQLGVDFKLLDEVMRINDDQRQQFLQKVRSAMWNIKRKRLAALGLSFKGGTDDMRESPALAIVKSLLDEGGTVVAYDPAAIKPEMPDLQHERLAFAGDPYAAAQGAHALLILTDWAEFRALDLGRLRRVLRYPIVIDGRNLYRPDQMAEAGLEYWSVGRPPTVLHKFSVSSAAA